MTAKVISNFKLQIELPCSNSDGNKVWKRTGDWDPVIYRLGLKNSVFDYLRFYEIKLRCYVQKILTKMFKQCKTSYDYRRKNHVQMKPKQVLLAAVVRNFYRDLAKVKYDDQLLFYSVYETFLLIWAIWIKIDKNVTSPVYSVCCTMQQYTLYDVIHFHIYTYVHACSL